MENRPQVIGDFVKLVSAEIEDGVVRNLDFKELEQYKNILVIRSVKNDIFHKMLIRIADLNSNMKLNILGNGISREFLDQMRQDYGKIETHIYIYDGRFDVNRLNEYRTTIMEENKLDAVVFLSYSPHRESYLNIEAVANCFAKEGQLPVYSIMADGELCKYTNIENHINAMNLYVSIVKWFHV